MNKLLIEKHIPKKIEDYNLNKTTKIILNKMIETKFLKILIHGSIGSGKSRLISTIQDIYNQNNKIKIDEGDILYISVLKDQGINYYRNEVKNFCDTSILKTKKKFIIIDDLDNFNEQTQIIFDNFIKIYENINFIITCTDILKINKNIKDKLEIVIIENIDDEYIKNILDKILEKENIEISDDCKNYILKLSNYSISNMINYLEKIFIYNYSNKNFDIKDLNLIKNISSNILLNDYEKYLNYCKNKNLKEAIKHIKNLCDIGYSVIDILEGLVTYIKHYSTIEENIKFKILKILLKYINIFYNIHEDRIELIFLTNNIVILFN